MIFRPDLILIDGTSYIYRAFHALPPLTTSDGKPTGATRGFASMLRKLISKYPGVQMVMVFDAKGHNFRNDYYSSYKANRPPMPNELRVQIDDIKKLSFEKAMEELSDIVENLESGNIDLEKSIEYYTRGSQLRAHCQQKLDEAVLKLEEIKVLPDGKISKKSK